MRGGHLGHWAADTYIADLFLCFLHSLELRRICYHAVTFPFTLLKVLLVTNLRNTNTVMSGTKWRLKCARQMFSCRIMARDQPHSWMSSFNVFFVWVNKESPTNASEIIIYRCFDLHLFNILEIKEKKNHQRTIMSWYFSACSKAFQSPLKTLCNSPHLLSICSIISCVYMDPYITQIIRFTVQSECKWFMQSLSSEETNLIRPDLNCQWRVLCCCSTGNVIHNNHVNNLILSLWLE